MTIKQELETILQSELKTMHELMSKGTVIDIVELTQTQQKLYELINSGVFTDKYAEETKEVLNKDVPVDKPNAERQKIKVVSVSKTKHINLNSRKQEIDDDPDVVAQGFFKQSIKGGYVKHLFIPEKLTRMYHLKHDDWAVVHGNEATFTNIEIIEPPITDYDSENHPSTSKLKLFQYARVDETENGEKYIKENIYGDLLYDYTGLDKMILLPEYNSHRLPTGSVVDLRFDHTQETPDPRIVWVHEIGELFGGNGGITPKPGNNPYTIKERGNKEWQDDNQ